MTDDAPEAAGEKKPDPRHSQHEDLGAEVQRDLTGRGHLARGSVTRFSTLRFHSQGKPRSERDPVFERPLEPQVGPPAADAATPPASEPPAPEPAVLPPQTVLGRVARMFGL